jgi:hypothetical protein
MAGQYESGDWLHHRPAELPVASQRVAIRALVTRPRLRAGR